MKTICIFCGILFNAATLTAQFQFTELTPAGTLTLADTFTNGVCVIEKSEAVDGLLAPIKNVFSTGSVAQTSLSLTEESGYYRAYALDLSNGETGFTNLTRAYGLLSTIAGAGAPQEQNNWRPEFENGSATNARLSSPHIAMADRAGNLYIADKDAHGIRKARPDGTIITVAGTNGPGNAPDELMPATEVGLKSPNGLWVWEDGTTFILDLDNSKVRCLYTNGMMRTLFTAPAPIMAGRGLWVSDDAKLVYYSSSNHVMKWTEELDEVTPFSTGYVELGNLVMDLWGNLVVTDRGSHRVYRLDHRGNRTVIAGNGATSGGDGIWATNTAIREVRGVWFLPTGAFVLCTHRGSQVWYVDPDGRIFLMLNGYRSSSSTIGSHAGDGAWFYNPSHYRVSECRAITMDYEGNLILTEHDMGYIRKVKFLPFGP